MPFCAAGNFMLSVGTGRHSEARYVLAYLLAYSLTCLVTHIQTNHSHTHAYDRHGLERLYKSLIFDGTKFKRQKSMCRKEMKWSFRNTTIIFQRVDFLGNFVKMSISYVEIVLKAMPSSFGIVA